jgi:hypothetical protein
MGFERFNTSRCRPALQAEYGSALLDELGICPSVPAASQFFATAAFAGLGEFDASSAHNELTKSCPACRSGSCQM